MTTRRTPTTEFVVSELGNRLANLIIRRPDVLRSSSIKQQPLSALLQIQAEGPLRERELEVLNQRGAIISLRSQGLIEAV